MALALLAGPARAGQGRRLAVLVGVENFADLNIGRLEYAKADVALMRAWLLDPKGGGFRAEDVTVLLDQEATVAGVVAMADGLIAQSRPDDLVLIYVSSHGFFTDQDGEVGVALHDSESTGRWGPDGPILQRQTTLTKGFVVCLLDRLKARRRAMIIDLCHSAGVTQGLDWACELSGEPVYPATGAKGAAAYPRPEDFPLVTVIAASCLGRQRAWESNELGASIFTHYLVEGLRRFEGDLPWAFDYAKGRTQRQADAEKGQAQTPRLIHDPPWQGLNLAIGAQP